MNTWLIIGLVALAAAAMLFGWSLAAIAGRSDRDAARLAQERFPERRD